MASRRIDQRLFGQLQLCLYSPPAPPGMSKHFFMICVLFLLSRTAEPAIRSVARIRQRGEFGGKPFLRRPPTLPPRRIIAAGCRFSMARHPQVTSQMLRNLLACSCKKENILCLFESN